ncbi:hypothetical protein NP493_582g02050 [Ridgeia piscesae]|uniref:Uncharacterized protein n=1 Tax=Ridgeia piscesae TaxID=27915 RepID=A0AAD9KUN3_RIDPI|nr:hypothetical protein NP493_582g02050 [Ridgeia piscesae]
MYYLCEPLGNGQFRRHHLTCGVLYWNQIFHTCVFSKPAKAQCEEGTISVIIQPTTPVADCPYEPYPGDSSKFWISGDENSLMTCVEGMQFFNNDDLCDCLPVTQ